MNLGSILAAAPVVDGAARPSSVPAATLAAVFKKVRRGAPVLLDRDGCMRKPRVFRVPLYSQCNNGRTRMADAIRRTILAAILAAMPAAAQHPDLGGIWNSASATPLERPVQLKEKAFFTQQEAADWESQAAARNAESPNASPAANVGTYNTAWREFGPKVVKTLRTSIITDPPDGRIPPLTPAAGAEK